jgi:periplasmic protein TonB
MLRCIITKAGNPTGAGDGVHIMYAEHGYMPRQSRSISFGAAFAINGAVVAGMLFYLAPNVISKGPEKPIPVIDIDDPTIPPIEKPKPLPRSEPVVATAPLPTVPDPIVPARSDTVIDGTTTEYETLPPLTKAAEGAPMVAEPAAVLPPLVGAAQDPKYMKDFQPGYPSAELRAQRDGAVRIKVLIGIDGRVKAVESVSATSDAFFEATRRQALSKWRFRPATRGGVPQESWKTMNVRFEIKNQ